MLMILGRKQNVTWIGIRRRVLERERERGGGKILG